MRVLRLQLGITLFELQAGDLGDTSRDDQRGIQHIAFFDPAGAEGRSTDAELDAPLDQTKHRRVDALATPVFGMLHPKVDAGPVGDEHDRRIRAVVKV